MRKPWGRPAKEGEEERVLPAWWSDNCVSLAPGEKPDETVGGTATLGADRRLRVSLAAGGGFVAVFRE